MFPVVERIEAMGFRRIGCLRYQGGKFHHEWTDPHIADMVYMYVRDGQIVFIGETGSTIRKRAGGFKSFLNSTKCKNPKRQAEFIASLGTGATLDIYGKKAGRLTIDYLADVDCKPLSTRRNEEEALINVFNPVLNVRDNRNHILNRL